MSKNTFFLVLDFLLIISPTVSRLKIMYKNCKRKKIIFLENTFGFLRETRQTMAFAKVNCSGERLNVCHNNLRILNIFSSFTLIKTRKIS
jgi:hypothetical protein